MQWPRQPRQTSVERSFRPDPSVELTCNGMALRAARVERQAAIPFPSVAGIMATNQPPPKSIDEYIALFSPEVQSILERIRSTVASAAPEAKETISYRIPAFTLNGALVYFAAFKNHIGFYPPVKGHDRGERQRRHEDPRLQLVRERTAGLHLFLLILRWKRRRISMLSPNQCQHLQRRTTVGTSDPSRSFDGAPSGCRIL